MKTNIQLIKNYLIGFLIGVSIAAFSVSASSKSGAIGELFSKQTTSTTYSLNGQNIADDTITSAEVKDDSITSSSIANNAVTTNKIRKGVINSTHIQDGSLVGRDFADATLGAKQIYQNFKVKSAINSYSAENSKDAGTADFAKTLSGYLFTDTMGTTYTTNGKKHIVTLEAVDTYLMKLFKDANCNTATHVLQWDGSNFLCSTR